MWDVRDAFRATMRRRLDPDQRLGLRLTLGFVGVFVFVVPFLLLLLLVEDRWAPLRHLDHGAAADLNNAVYGHPAVIDALKAVSLVFGPTTFRIIGVALTIFLLVRRRVRLALFTAVAILGGSLLDGAAKLLSGRHRPVLAHPVTTAPGLSFPSGHALGSLVGVVVVILVFLPVMSRTWRRVSWVAGAVVVVAVGFSRIALGVHWVSDVLGGWLLAAAWLFVTTAAFATWRRQTGRRVQLSHGLEPEAAKDLSVDVHDIANVGRSSRGSAG